MLRRVGEVALTAPEVGPLCSHLTGSQAIAEVNHDQPPRVALPAPCEEILIPVISRPT